MTCISCGFENPDSETHCFRCGRSLNTDDIDVVPDRLKRGPSSRWSQAWRAALERVSFRWFRSPAYTYALLSLIPGLGHWAAGHPRRGWIALGSWCACLVLRCLLSPPPLWSSAMLQVWLTTQDMLTMVVHTSIVADAYRLAPNRYGRLQGLHLFLVALASYGLLSLGHSLLGASLPRQMIRIGYPGYQDSRLQAGDSIMVWGYPNWRRIHRQTPVLYAPPGALGGRLHIYGDLVGTVLAVPGDELRLTAGQLRVNGQGLTVAPWVTRALENLPPQEFRLGSEQYLILPPLEMPFTKVGDLLVYRQQIQGVVTEILDPPARRQRLSW